MDLGPHAAFIWISYAAVTLVISALVAWLWIDARRQSAALQDLEARGITRRSASVTSKEI